MNDLAKQLIARLDAMKSRRSNWDSYWQDIADYVLPNREFTTRLTPGSERRQKIYNNTPGEALERLVGGITSLLTNQSLKWFDFGVRNARPTDKASRWLSETRDITLSLLNAPSVNLYSALDECYESLAGFGTGIIYSENDNGLRFKSIPLGACYIEEDYMGVVDTLYREFDLSLRQIIDAFGMDSLPPQLHNKLHSSNDPTSLLAEKHRLVHCVGPREDYNPSSSFSTKKQYYSTVVHVGYKHIMSNGGYDRMPFFVPRWRKGSGEIYGRSPGMVLLHDIRYLNAMSKAALNSAAKAADPPVQMPDNGFLRPARLNPGGLNVYRSSSLGRIEPIDTGSRPDFANAMITEIEGRIRMGFYNDMFQLPEIDRMTATETIQRQQERRQLFSPTLNRLYGELLNPIVFDAFEEGVKQGLISSPPDEIAGRQMDIHYVSPLARAQRSSEVASYQEWLASIAMLSETSPQIMDNAHPDRIAARLASAVSLPEDMRTTDEERQHIRELRLQKIQEEQQMMEAAQAAVAAKDGAQALGALRG